MTALHGSYAAADVEFLLKPIVMPSLDIAEKEALLQSGSRHYSEMLSREALPSPAYLATYHAALERNGAKLAGHIEQLADTLAKRNKGARGLALASLARAGTPIGILLRRALHRRGVKVAHYSISIVRDRGIDLNALAHILDRHDGGDVLFVDGWTGKGAIAGELRGPRGSRAAGIEPFLVVVADPAGRADLAATFEDYVIPSGILGGIVSGLVSRSVLNAEIGPHDFHGCVRLDYLAAADVSRDFVDRIAALGSAAPRATVSGWTLDAAPRQAAACDALVAQIAAASGTTDRNRIKPGIAEATRAVLRRVPDRLLLSDPVDPELRHLVALAEERGVNIVPLPGTGSYRAVAIIAAVGGD